MLLAAMCRSGEIGGDFLHSGLLGDAERAAAVAVAALEAGVGFDGQLAVVVVRHSVARTGKVIVFVDQPDIDSGRAGLAVIAVDAVSDGVLRRKAADHRIVVFFWRRLQKRQERVQIRKAADTRNSRQNSRTVEDILQALIFGQRPVEG